MSAPALWTVDDMAVAMGAERQGVLPQAVSGLSIDSRSIAPGTISAITRAPWLPPTTSRRNGPVASGG